MTSFKPSDTNPLVISFDGTVLEVFRMSTSIRLHITLVDKLELKTDKKGIHTFDIHSVGGYSLQDVAVDDAGLPKLNALSADLQKAKARFKFD